MNLVIDIGNTRTKIAFFKNDTLVETKIYNQPMVCDFELELRQKPETDKCIVSSTAVIDSQLEQYLNNTFPDIIFLTGNSKLPFENRYLTKETQGPDRIAAIAGGQFLYPSKALLVIDAGTAITFDLLDAKGIYLGGNISPGLSIRYKALNEFTGKLPLLEKKDESAFLGNETNEAIVAGVQNGIFFEIEGYIDVLTKKYPNLTTIMTGGDADFLANKLKRIIFVHENLVLIGLNRILTYNAQL